MLYRLKNCLRYAVRNEWIEKNPFRYHKMEIDKKNVKVSLTGPTFTDVGHLWLEHLTTDEEGQRGSTSLGRRPR